MKTEAQRRVRWVVCGLSGALLLGVAGALSRDPGQIGRIAHRPVLEDAVLAHGDGLEWQERLPAPDSTDVPALSLPKDAAILPVAVIPFGNGSLEVVAGEVLAKFSPALSREGRDRLIARLGSTLLLDDAMTGYVRLKVPEGLSIPGFQALLKGTEGVITAQPIERPDVEHVGHQTLGDVPLEVRARALRDDEAGRLLPAVLQRVEAQIRQPRSLGMTTDRKDAAHRRAVLYASGHRRQARHGVDQAMPPQFGGAALNPVTGPAIDTAPGDRFSDRARALFYARLAFLAIGLGVLAVPSWSAYVGATGTTAFAVYFTVIGYSVSNYLLLEHPRIGRPLTFVTLNLDLVALGAMVIASGGLKSPVMAGQVLFTIFFVLLFPRLWALIPPLLLLPVVARIE